MADIIAIANMKHKTNKWPVTKVDLSKSEHKQQCTVLTKINRHLMTLMIAWLTATAAICLSGAALIQPAQAQAEDLSDLFSNSNVEMSQDDFLQVDEAFTVVPIQQGNKLTISMEITPGHYLYQDKLSLVLPKGVSAKPFKFSKSSHSIDDSSFGRVAIFDQSQVVATTTLSNTNNKPVHQKGTLTWQGCAKLGLCYPPQKQPVTLNLAASEPETQPSSAIKNDNTKPKLPSPTMPNKQPSTADKPLAKSNLSVVQELKTAKYKAANTKKNNEDKQTDTNRRRPIIDTQEISNDEIEVAENDLADENQLLLQSQSQNRASVDNNKSENEQTNLVSVDKNVRNSQILSSPSSDTLKITTVIDQDPFGLAKHPWLALGLLFLAGIGLAFTPCVLPMLPIVSNIIARQHKPTAKGGLLLSGSYALGIAVAYGLLGAIIAIFGQSLGIIGWLQNPVILLSFAIVFILLGLYMLDAFMLPIPNKIKQKLQSASQSGDKGLGSVLGSFIAGILSALVVSPCVSAPLFGALLAVSTIGNPMLGFAALFMLGFGLSAPLMLLGLGQGNFMPKAGAWMNWVKQGFALLLFAVALLLISRVFMSPLMLILWAIWVMVVAGWAWVWEGRSRLLTKPLAMILAIWSTLCLIGAAAGSEDLLQPLDNFKPSYSQSLGMTKDASTPNSILSNSLPSMKHADIHITSLEDLHPIVNQNAKVLVDVTADWCLECRIMDKTLFSNRPSALQDWQLVQLDITESNEESSRVLSELKLFGPPVLLYFVEGNLKVQQVGAVARSDFEKTLARF